MFFSNRNKNLESVFQWILRISVISVIVIYFVSLNFLPVENEEFFEINLVKKFDTEITEDDILYKGTFERLNRDNTTVPIELPCKLEAGKGDKVMIKSIIPDDFDSDYIIVRSSQQNLTIYIGGIARVHYNTSKSRPFGSQTTSRYVFCRTSAADAGKTLHIATVSDSAAYTGVVNSVYACSRYDFWQYIWKTNATTIILGVIAIAIGFFLILIGMVLSYSTDFKSSLENVGFCMLFVGAWLTCESRVRQVISPNASAISNICFIVIMLGPLPLLMYINDLQKRRYNRVYRWLISIACANSVIQLSLQLFNVRDFLDMLFISHVILGLSILAGILLIIKDIRLGLAKDYYEMCVGSLILMISLILEVLRTYSATMMSGIFVTAGIIVFALFAIFQTMKEYRAHERARQEEVLRTQKAHSDSITMQMIRTFSDTIEAKDEFNKGHANRVAFYTKLIARKLGLSEEEITRLQYAASLHDLGKIGVADTILIKPGKLTEEEYEIIKRHTTIGADIIKGIELISYAEEAARYHHERYDGTGYPEGLKGEEIPLGARIITVADAYDAMNTKRVYRDKLSQEMIREEILKNAGTQFDPAIANIFLNMLDDNEDIISEVPDVEDESTLIDVTNITEAGQMFSAVMNQMMISNEEDNIDFLTGLPLRNKGEAEISKQMKLEKGTLIFFDMDNLKTVNDIFGHKMGDAALRNFGDLLANASDRMISCRVGGDEFISFFTGSTKEEAGKLVENIIKSYADSQKDLPMIQRTSISAGLYITSPDEKFEEAMNRADKALYYVKKSGKNNYSFYMDVVDFNVRNAGKTDLNNLVNSIRTSGTYYGSLNIEYREFTKIYEYIVKLCRRYEHTCHLILVSLETEPGSNIGIDDFENAMECMGIAIKENIRNVDVCTRYSSVQYLVILLEAGDQNIDMVMQRVFKRYYDVCKLDGCRPVYQASAMRKEDDQNSDH